MLAAQKLKSLVTEYGLTKQDLFVAVKQTEWGNFTMKFSNWRSKKERIKLTPGYYTTIETKGKLKTFFANIKRRGLRRLRAKQKLKNHPAV